MSSMGTVNLQSDRRYERASLTRASGTTTASEGFLEKSADLAVGIGEVAGRCVAVIGGDDQPSAGRQAFDEGPEVIAGELFGCVTGQCVEPLASP